MKGFSVLENWRDNEAYSYLKDMPYEGWRWEFIRRGKRYAADYADFLRRKELINRKIEGGWREKIFSYHPPKPPRQSVNAWKIKWHDLGVVARPLNLAGEMGKFWGLYTLYNPAMKYTDGVRYFENEIRMKHTVNYIDELERYTESSGIEESDDENRIRFNKRYKVFVIDLEGDHEYQLERFRMLLEIQSKKQESKKGKIQDRAKQWPIYLRALDADHAGAEKIDIGITLGKNLLASKDRHPSAVGYDIVRNAKGRISEFERVSFSFFGGNEKIISD